MVVQQAERPFPKLAALFHPHPISRKEVFVLVIPLPRGVGPGDFKRLRSHATWYQKQVALFGPSYGAKSRARARRRGQSIREELSASSRIGSVL